MGFKFNHLEAGFRTMTLGEQTGETNVRIDNIISELRSFIRSRFSVPESDTDFNDHIDLFNYGYIDSLGAADLTSFIERHYGIKFSDTDWVSEPLSNITEIAQFVWKRRSEGTL